MAGESKEAAWTTTLKENPKSAANAIAVKSLLEEIAAQESIIRQGGGAKAVEAQRAKGRLTVRERLGLLLDEGTEFLELGLWAAHGMYEEWGGAPGAGVVTGNRACAGEALHDRCERCDRQGRSVFSDDCEEGASGADHCAGESDTHALPCRFEWRVSSAAGRSLPRSG